MNCHAWLPMVCALVCGCQERIAATPITSVGKVEALWAGGGLCVRTAEGLVCAMADHKEPFADAARVARLGNVKDVAMTIGRACALDERGVSCFRPGDAKATPAPFEAPRQVIAIHGGTPCVLHAKGVSCWKDYDEEPMPVPQLGKPRRLLAVDLEHMICGVDSDGVRCFGIDARDHEITNIGNPTTVVVDTWWSCALDELGGVGCVRNP